MLEPPASFHSPVSFRPGVEDDYTSLRLPPIAPVSISSKLGTELRSIYQHYQGAEELCDSCTTSYIKSWIQCEHPESWEEIAIGTFAEIRRRTRCLLYSTIYRALKLQMPYNMFRKGYQSNNTLTLSQMPGRWQRGFSLKDESSTGLRSPCSILSIRMDREYCHRQLSSLLSKFNIYYNIRLSNNSSPRLRQFSEVNLQFCMTDYSLIKSWLSLYNEYHGESCSPEKSGTSSSLDIHLIDITSRSIIIAKATTRYITLSYIWSTGYTGNITQTAVPNVSSRLLPKFLPPRAPQTIEDAISIVQELGEQFLWIDTYCIDQNDPLEREHVINNMHHIYECAVLTICTLSGTSSNSGLPGISHALNRRPQY